jgi:broad specificity phosphatase PhoE
MTAPSTVVHMLRHGEVDNPGKVLYGRLPGFRLSELGEQMARRPRRRSPGVTSQWSCQAHWSERYRRPNR